MHPNPIFRQTPEARNIAFARAQAFGMLAVGVEGAPLLAHVPFLLTEDGAVAEFHLVRSNPIARALSAPLCARLAVVGPYSYVSPDWYGAEDQVPTWNYVAVHLVGEVELRPEDELRDLLDRQSAHFEDQLLPKAPWTSDKMTPDVMARMMRQIVPCRMRVDEIHGTWKLNQNKDDDVRLRAADAVEASGMGVEVGALAALMRDAKG
ncbi:FMN-binding negative transcriptional regulator [Roseovarius atlanticus]|uniref:FMN-binding negative transcriptional regulator n=1 Tax=Roseovarius atlanticus TaxID=1641875 RepID=UPI001C93EED4|nr:FMN-binding negative transcriptional regulator [Roseovarius atlanticus]MBY5986853.1 FMN-binding negative transcriptional regulator [Roseovarius atlanticus]MBY6125493.1 FMN-binding negative transcriptional regulator [Roseovarius atlanticus]MBY6150046.1 FMN-binding negative transcriptional regulator [Roseovarius atlanticus]